MTAMVRGFSLAVTPRMVRMSSGSFIFFVGFQRMNFENDDYGLRKESPGMKCLPKQKAYLRAKAPMQPEHLWHPFGSAQGRL
jgi:hypothetical protein